MFGTLSNIEMEDLIYQQIIGRIACYADNVSYIVPISYAYDGVYIYARTFEGMKINMMRKNPNICFQVDDLNDLSNWKSVVAWGTFEELHAGSERDKAVQTLINRNLPILHSETMHLSPLWPFTSTQDEHVEGVIFRIYLTEKTGKFEKSLDGPFFST